MSLQYSNIHGILILVCSLCFPFSVISATGDRLLSEVADGKWSVFNHENELKSFPNSRTFKLLLIKITDDNYIVLEHNYGSQDVASNLTYNNKYGNGNPEVSKATALRRGIIFPLRYYELKVCNRDYATQIP